MKDERNVIYNESNFSEEALANIPKDFHGKITLKCDAIIHGDFFLPCALTCQKLTVYGNLTVYGDIECEDLTVSETLKSLKSISVKNDICAKNFKAAGTIDCGYLNVKKHFSVHALKVNIREELIVGN